MGLVFFLENYPLPCNESGGVDTNFNTLFDPKPLPNDSKYNPRALNG